MSALVNALDKHTPTQFGENGHVEYGWSNDIRERIVQFNFQLVRSTKNPNALSTSSLILCGLLTTLKNTLDSNEITEDERQIARGYLLVLYKMIGYTRDIIHGKGEYSLAYMMVYAWSKFYPELAKYALRCFVMMSPYGEHPYGSWKDLKYFCQYCKDQGDTINSPLIQYSIELMNSQLMEDYQKECEGRDDDISLVAKWIPREKSSFGWLYEPLVLNYFQDHPNWFSARNERSKTLALRLCKMKYRKIVSNLNRKLDTTQIKQCGRTWQAIHFDKVTSITLARQKNAFLNIRKNGTTRHSEDMDRIQCATNFQNHIKNAIKDGTEVKGKRIGMPEFTTQAVDIIRRHGLHSIEAELLDSQWRDNSSQNGALGNMIAMVDVSGSMEGTPMNVAIALGIRIAEKSVLGKRVMTFSEKPTWVNLEPYNGFVSQVNVIKQAPWGTNTNFYAALDMILDAIVSNKMPAKDVQDMVLVILSDMQMDQADKSNRNRNALYKTMEEKYHEAGIRVNGVPYKPPHILFWNLEHTSGFPVLSNQANASMMSGFSPVLLNLFCDQGMEALQSCTPWSILEKSLEHDRYQILATRFNNEL